MEVKFEVHNPHVSNMYVNAQVDGETVPAEMKVFEVELKTVDGISGTLSLRYKGGGIDAAKALFTEGKSITGTFA